MKKETEFQSELEAPFTFEPYHYGPYSAEVVVSDRRGGIARAHLDIAIWPRPTGLYLPWANATRR